MDGFKESVVENVTGLMFKSEDVESLANVMMRILDQHPIMYNRIKVTQKEYVEQNLKIDAVVSKYKNMFDSINS